LTGKATKFFSLPSFFFSEGKKGVAGPARAVYSFLTDAGRTDVLELDRAGVLRPYRFIQIGPYVFDM
jgi:hypothetical protein